RVDARPGEALGDELAAGCAENALAGADRVSARSNHLDTRTVHEVSVRLLALSSGGGETRQPGTGGRGGRPLGGAAGGGGGARAGGGRAARAARRGSAQCLVARPLRLT